MLLRMDFIEVFYDVFHLSRKTGNIISPCAAVQMPAVDKQVKTVNDLHNNYSTVISVEVLS